MFPPFRWSALLRPPVFPPQAVAVPDALRSHVDDCERRLARAPEQPRRLQYLADYGVRALCGRFPG